MEKRYPGSDELLTFLVLERWTIQMIVYGLAS